MLFGRKKGEDSWYSPDRDILNVMPSCIVRGAAYAADPTSSIYSWLIRQDGVNSVNVVDKVRKGLEEMLRVLDDIRSAPLSEVLRQDRVEWPILQAIMFGAGIVGLNTYNVKFREARLTTLRTGAVEEPTTFIDHLVALAIFNDLIRKSHGGANDATS